jgi:Holliday junction DNA helicase RuvA
MIGKLSGRIDSISGSHVIIDVGGVGYVVACSARTLRTIGSIGEPTTLRIETHVREDAINLYGFADTTEQEWFRLLTTVQGVGAKVGLAILSSLSPEQLSNAIASQDKVALTQADGVGPKLGLRLVTELKDKITTFISSPPKGTTMGEVALSSSLSTDALSALINLGYRRSEAFAAVTSANARNPNSRLDDLIRLSLAELSRKDNAA